MATRWRVRVSETRHLTAEKIQTTTRVAMDNFMKEIDAQAYANAYNGRNLRTPRHPELVHGALAAGEIPELFLPQDVFSVEPYNYES